MSQQYMIGVFFLHLFQLQALRNYAKYLSPLPSSTVLLISLFWIYNIRLFCTIARRIVQNIIGNQNELFLQVPAGTITPCILNISCDVMFIRRGFKICLFLPLWIG